MLCSGASLWGPRYAGLMQMISMQSILRDWFSASADSQRILLQKVERLVKAKITFSEFLTWFVSWLGRGGRGDHAASKSISVLKLSPPSRNSDIITELSYYNKTPLTANYNSWWNLVTLCSVHLMLTDHVTVLIRTKYLRDRLENMTWWPGVSLALKGLHFANNFVHHSLM